MIENNIIGLSLAGSVFMHCGATTHGNFRNTRIPIAAVFKTSKRRCMWQDVARCHKTSHNFVQHNWNTSGKIPELHLVGILVSRIPDISFK